MSILKDSEKFADIPTAITLPLAAHARRGGNYLTMPTTGTRENLQTKICKRRAKAELQELKAGKKSLFLSSHLLANFYIRRQKKMPRESAGS